MGLMDVLLTLLVLLASALCVYLIITLKKVNESLTLLQRDLSDINSKLLPILDNIQEVSQKALYAAEEAERQVNKIQNFVSSAKEKIGNIGSITKSNPESRIQSFVKNLTALSKAVTAFVSEFKKS